MKNVFEAIEKHGNDEEFVPRDGRDFPSTDAQVGSPERIATMVWRVAQGLPLWHPDDGPNDDSHKSIHSQWA